MSGGFKWLFSCRDVTGLYQTFHVFAKTKDAAIQKGIRKAGERAGGIIIEWSSKFSIS